MTALVPADRFVARKSPWSLFGRSFQLYGADGVLAFQVDRQRFRIRDAMTVWADASRSRAALTIKARSFLDFSSTFDVTDAATGTRVGALARKGLASLLRDEWTVIGADDRPVGRVVEDSAALALVRRFLPFGALLAPEAFHVELDGRTVGRIVQRFNPFVLTYDVDFSADPERALDRRLAVAIVVLLLAVEGRQRKED